MEYNSLQENEIQKRNVKTSIYYFAASSLILGAVLVYDFIETKREKEEKSKLEEIVK